MSLGQFNVINYLNVLHEKRMSATVWLKQHNHCSVIIITPSNDNHNVLNSLRYSSLLIAIIKGRLTEIILLTRRRAAIDIYNNNTVRPNVLAEVPWGAASKVQPRVSF